MSVNRMSTSRRTRCADRHRPGTSKPCDQRLGHQAEQRIASIRRRPPSHHLAWVIARAMHACARQSPLITSRWPARKPRSSRSRRRCCSRPMRAASFRWPRAPTTRRCTGSSREQRGIIPLDGFHVPSRLARTVRVGPLHRRRRPRLRRRDRRLRRAAARTAPRPGSTPASAGSIAACSTSAIATPSRSTTATRLVGGLYGVSLGAHVLRREHVPPRARRLQDRAGASGRAAARRRLRAARHPVRHRSSDDLRRDRGAAAPAITSCSPRRSRGEADFAALPLDAPIAGARGAGAGDQRRSSEQPSSALIRVRSRR